MSYTLTVPQTIVRSAECYAGNRGITLNQLICDYLVTVVGSAPKPRRRKVRIPASIKSISGIVTLPPEMSESDVMYEAAMSN